MSGLVEMAQSMTSLRLVVKEGTEGRQSVAFQSHAPRWVDLHSNGPRRVFISSLTAPTLYQLIWMAADPRACCRPCLCRSPQKGSPAPSAAKRGRRPW
jgi:hypothetical protein